MNLVEMERLELPRENPADLQSAPIPIREHLQGGVFGTGVEPVEIDTP